MVDCSRRPDHLSRRHHRACCPTNGLPAPEPILSFSKSLPQLGKQAPRDAGPKGTKGLFDFKVNRRSSEYYPSPRFSHKARGKKGVKIVASMAEGLTHGIVYKRAGKEKKMVEQMDWQGVSKWKLDTPCLVVDEDKLEQNIRKMQTHVGSFGKKLRPHAKTHKCSRIAKMQMEAGAVGICVAKVSEAEVLARCGVKGTLITSPIVTDYKIARLMDCLSLDPEVMVVVDNAANAQKLSEEAERRGLGLNVLIDLDPGVGRTGVSFKDGLAMGQMIRSLPGLRLQGVQCYAGQVQHIASFEERLRTSLGWMGEAANVVRQFREKEFPCDIFTGSGTGTWDIDCRIPDLTDMQTGSYTMMDAEYLGIGSSENPSRFEGFSPALTLLTSVISTNHADHVTVDAGLKALYHDGATPYVLYPPIPALEYKWRGDEHGQIGFPTGSARFGLGDVLELVVSHCDPTVNLFDVLYMTRDEIVTDIWPIDMRGKCR